MKVLLANKNDLALFANGLGNRFNLIESFAECAQ